MAVHQSRQGRKVYSKRNRHSNSRIPMAILLSMLFALLLAIARTNPRLSWALPYNHQNPSQL
jgi:hypothetical protein